MPASDARAIRLTPKAEEDLEGIWIYTAETWSPSQADRYLDQLYETLDFLAVMPDIARERTEFVPSVRIHPSGSHLIVYQAGDEQLLIIRVLGARQDWQTLLRNLDP